MHRHLFISSCASLLVLAACGGDDTAPPGTDSGPPPADAGQHGDAGPAPRDAGPCTGTVEDCNGLDDDCDGLVDEGSGLALGCGAGICMDGACVCPPERMCGGTCVDITRDRDHCGACGSPCPATQVCNGSTCCDPATDPVDVLFMVDNSNSMTEEQASLAAAFPRMIDVLTTGDVDGDGTPDFPSVADLHVGVVTSDMGTGGVRVPTCANPDLGDDGILRTRGNTSLPGCMATYPSFLSYRDGDATAAFAATFGCVAQVGTGGCGFEQQLEAALKALTPSTLPTTFVMGTSGHGDRENALFVRPHSVLAVVIVSDEEDCSAADPDLFNPASGTYTGDLNLRCFSFPAAVHPIARYVDGLLALRSDPGDLIFTLIGGVPVDLVADSASIDYDAILADPRMGESVDPTMPTRLIPSCNSPSRGLAFPPRRMVAVAQGLATRGAGTLVQSICQADLGAAMGALAQRVGASISATCR